MINKIIVLAVFISLQFLTKVNGHWLQCSEEVFRGMESTAKAMTLSEAIRIVADLEKNSNSDFSSYYYNGFHIRLYKRDSHKFQMYIMFAHLSMLDKCFVKDNTLSAKGTFFFDSCIIQYHHIDFQSLKYSIENNYVGDPSFSTYNTYENILAIEPDSVSSLNANHVSEINIYLRDRPWLHYGLNVHTSRMNGMDDYKTQVSCSKEVFIGSRAIKEIVSLDEGIQSTISEISDEKHKDSNNNVNIFAYVRSNIDALKARTCLELAYQNLFKYCLIDEGKQNLNSNISSERKS